MEYRYHIGIDAGKQTGIAVWDATEKKFDQLQTVDFWQVVDLLITGVDRRYCRTESVVWVEDPGLNRPVFDKPGADNRRKTLHVAQAVGSVKRESELLIEGLNRYMYEVRAVRPSTGKWTAKTFKKITGYPGRTSQHARDAAKLVFGR